MGHTKIGNEDVSLYTLSGDKLYTPAGMLERIKGVFKDSGITYNYKDVRKKKMPAADISKVDVADLRTGQDKALAAIFSHDMGQVVAPTAFGKSYLILQICKAYPTANIIVCARQRAVVGTIFDSLYKEFPGVVGKMGGGYKMKGKRITVSTAKSLKKNDLNKCDIFIYDEVHTAASPELSSVLSTIRHARMFGLTATPTGRFDGAEKRIEALFGPVIFTMDYAEAEKAGNIVPIRVFMYEVPGMPQTMHTRSSVTKKRRCFWRNRLRNELIGKVANSFSADTQVLIMVDTVDHAYHLGRYLPDFTKCYSNMSQQKRNMFIRSGLMKSTERYMTNKLLDYYRRQFESRKLLKVISTNIWGAGVNFNDLQVLIRADGAPGAIPSTQIPGRLSRLAEGKEAGLLIDFADRFDPWTCKRALSRLKTYKSNGWEILNETFEG